MSRNASSGSGSPLWTGKPWIVPSAIVRTILVVIAVVVISWLELSFDNIAFDSILGLPVILWTGAVLLLVWLFSLIHLLLIKASSTYILRNDSLEIRTGIITSKSFMLSPSGFSDLEVVRSISARIVNSGDILIRTQSETDSNRKMQRLRNPMKVAEQIREVMARPIVRIEGQERTEEKK